MGDNAAVADIGVADLDGVALRDVVSALSRSGLEVARDKYAAAHQWCVTHPPVDEVDAATFGDARLPGMSGECDLRVGGEGTPGVAVFAVEAYAAIAGLSTGAAVQVLSDALDLQHRLKRTWARVVSLEVPAWIAARIAAETSHLSQNAANWIDTELDRLGAYGWKRIAFVIKQAVASFHPELLDRPEVGRDDWDVTVDHDGGCAEGTSRLDAIGDSLDLEKFHNLICDEAATLGRLGDPDSLGQRKAKALGVLADRHATCQGTLDLAGAPAAAADPDGAHGRTAAGGGSAPEHAAARAARAASVAAGFGDPTCPDTGERISKPRSYLRPKLYLHLSLADLLADLDGGPNATVIDAGKLGPQLLAVIKEWLAACGSDARITPVIDLNRAWSVDRHDPPEAMREAVILRDEHCVFPSCTVDARRCDLDHIVAYDPEGPPGQTSPDKLACLCRRHHRLKTFTAWTYRRDVDGSYLWTSPHRERWRVTPGQGTTRITDAA